MARSSNSSKIGIEYVYPAEYKLLDKYYSVKDKKISTNTKGKICFSSMDMFFKLMIFYYSKTDKRQNLNQLDKEKKISHRKYVWKDYFLSSAIPRYFGLDCIEVDISDIYRVLNNPYSCIVLADNYVFTNNDSYKEKSTNEKNDEKDEEENGILNRIYYIIEKAIESIEKKEGYSITTEDKAVISFYLFGADTYKGDKNYLYTRERVDKGGSKLPFKNSEEIGKLQEKVKELVKGIDEGYYGEKLSTRTAYEKGQVFDFPRCLKSLIYILHTHYDCIPFMPKTNVLKGIPYQQNKLLMETECQSTLLRICRYRDFLLDNDNFIFSRENKDSGGILIKESFIQFISKSFSLLEHWNDKKRIKADYYLVEKLFRFKLIIDEAKIITSYLGEKKFLLNDSVNLADLLKQSSESYGVFTRQCLAECVIDEFFKIYNDESISTYRKRLKYYNKIRKYIEKKQKSFRNEEKILLRSYFDLRVRDSGVSIDIIEKELDSSCGVIDWYEALDSGSKRSFDNKKFEDYLEDCDDSILEWVIYHNLHHVINNVDNKNI